ncbi:DUF6364 family protein [Arcicella lustrica]|uniref:DUF6364 family protein n=1 Tax=Arcicella lustrica TaxID=2984196 RepID=A0ABU5SQB8_9BACT|nr:DUF6364 family protein [Arcicella sp. DC25W]MEA5429477.1 DUF6364 family protein [Arcicella sp. DC25W]
MNAKLTLTIEQAVIDKAKKYAKEKERSLSDLIESYLKTLPVDNPQDEIELTPIVKSLKGTFSAPEKLDYKEELSNSLSEKYL